MIGDRLLKVLCILAALTAVLGFYLAVLGSPANLENDHRLVPTFAVARGYRLYYGPAEGPALSTIYGPVSALAYAPALLARTPMAAVRVATALSLIFFFVPAVLVAHKGVGQRGVMTWAATLGLVAALVFFSDALSRSAVLVHADAPAFAAASLACWLSGWRGQPGSRLAALLAGVASVASVMSKQNMLPIIAALGLWWLLISWRSLLLFATGLVASLAAILYAVQFVSSSPQAAWFNWFQIPTHQPYSKALLFPAIDNLLRQLLLYLLPLAAVVTPWLQSAKGQAGQPGRPRFNPTILLLGVGCCLIPTSVLGFIKAGGNLNALSPAIYFFALACAVELSAHFGQSRSGEKQPHGSMFTSTMTLLFLAIFVGVRLPEHLYSLAKGRSQVAMEYVYDFSRRHPGQVYFPQFPLTILMEEGHLYNFSWGLTDRRVAGYPVSDSLFREYTPPSANTMALIPWVPEWERDIYDRCIAGGALPTETALPGFSLCRFR